MSKDFELFTLSIFKKNMDNLAQYLIKYLNEYNEILTKIKNNKSDEITKEHKKLVNEFYINMINDNNVMDSIEFLRNVLKSCEEDLKKMNKI